MDVFIESWNWLAVGLIMIVEYLIGISRLESNSTIEMIINMVKFIFGIGKK